MIPRKISTPVSPQGLWPVLVILVGVLLAAATGSLYHTVMERAEGQARTSARAYGRLIANKIGDLDRFVSTAAKAVLVDRSLTPDQASILFQHRQRTQSLIQDLTILDQDGQLLAMAWDGEPPEVSGRDYFVHHVENPDSGLYLSPPQPSIVYEGDWFISLSRPFRDQGDQLLGVAVGMFSINQLKATFNDLVEQDGLAITLLTRCGELVFRLPGADRFETGSDLAFRADVQPPLNKPLTFHGAALDGTQRITHFLPIDGYPLTVAASIPRARPLNIWYRAIFAAVATWLVFAAISYGLIRRLRQSLHETQVSQARFRRLVEHASDLILVVGLDGRLQYVSPKWGDHVGLDPASVIGRNSLDFIHPDDHARVSLAIRAVIGKGISLSGKEYRARHTDGSWRWQAASISPLYDARGKPDAVIAVIRDVTDSRRDRQHLSRLAHEDALTGLPNRAHLSDLLNQAMREADRKGRRVGVLFIDLDRFKPVNDVHGHEVGDQLLVEVARRINHALRAPDIAARFGGDEFLALLHDLSDPDEALAIAGRIIDQIRKPFLIGEHELTIACSIGIALYPDDGRDERELILRADQTMYRAKHAGRGMALRYAPEAD
ncbi:MAG: diguanylate cyclase domain-containing protein [Wenzhouxiangella sp.]